MKQQPGGSRHVTCLQMKYVCSSCPRRQSRKDHPRVIAHKLRVGILPVSLLVKDAQGFIAGVKASQNWSPEQSSNESTCHCPSHHSPGVRLLPGLLKQPTQIPLFLFCSLQLKLYPSTLVASTGIKSWLPNSGSSALTQPPTTNLSNDPLIPVPHVAQASFNPTCCESSSFYLNRQGL